MHRDVKFLNQENFEEKNLNFAVCQDIKKLSMAISKNLIHEMFVTKEELAILNLAIYQGVKNSIAVICKNLFHEMFVTKEELVILNLAIYQGVKNLIAVIFKNLFHEMFVTKEELVILNLAVFQDVKNLTTEIFKNLIHEMFVTKQLAIQEGHHQEKAHQEDRRSNHHLLCRSMTTKLLPDWQAWERQQEGSQKRLIGRSGGEMMKKKIGGGILVEEIQAGEEDEVEGVTMMKKIGGGILVEEIRADEEDEVEGVMKTIIGGGILVEGGAPTNEENKPSKERSQLWLCPPLMARSTRSLP
jgi:hypothetical protein